jgi:ATP-binding cassette subfamily B multidrug efflux pump
MSGIRIIKALSKTGYETEKFDEVNSEVIRKEQRASILLSSVNPIMNLLLNTGLTLVIIVGAFRVNSGVTLPGKIIAFLSYFAIILNALMMVTRLFVIYSKGAASAKRITEVLAVPGERTAEAAPSDGGGYHIEFRNVRFSYNKVIDTLTDISFGLKRGETLGIIGATGSGKSTVINLLLRFYDADAGDILIDGTNVKNIPADILHTKFGVVFQNDFLFADTIRENIDFGRGIAEDSIKAAAENAQAGFINEKEGGLDFMLTVKGSNLSGGQKQRLLIARALAADPEILILDDSSSALDYLTDAALRKAVKRNFRDTTTVIVAQRVSAIMHAEKIIVLDEGSIIGSGTHEELLASCESYREIYNAQMGDIG